MPYQNNWSEKFAKNVEQDLQEFENKDKVDDHDIRSLFRKHALQLYQHYLNERNETGKIEDYLNAIDLANKLLDKKGKSLLGYYGFLKIASAYIALKLIGQKYYFRGELREIMIIARRNSVIERGKEVFPQITCNAEIDFSSLVKTYINFFVLSGHYNGKFTQSSINLGLMLPNVETIVKRRFKNIDDRIENFLDNEKEHIKRVPTKISTSKILSDMTIQKNVTINDAPDINKIEPSQIPSSMKNDAGEPSYDNLSLMKP